MVTTNSATTLFPSSVFEGLQEKISGLCGDFADIVREENRLIGQETEVLVAVLRAIKPVMKYIDGPVVVYESGDNDPQTLNHVEEYLDNRGIEIFQIGWVQVSSNLADGSVRRGQGLVLDRSMGLRLLDWEGYADGYQSGGYRARADVSIISRPKAVKMFGLKHILEGLNRVFNEALAKLEEQRASIQQRLDIVVRALPPEEETRG